MLSTPSRSPGRAIMRTPMASSQMLHSSNSNSTNNTGPTYALPTRVFAADPELSAMLHTDMQAVDFALRQLVTAQQDRRRAHETSLLECRQQESKLERLRGQLEVAQKDMQAQLAREKDEAEKGDKVVKDLESRKKALQEQVEGLRADVLEWESKLQRSRQAQTELDNQLAKQAAKNAPELAFLESKLGIQIRGKGRDVVTVTFSRIDATAFDRAFSFDLDLSPRDGYSIVGCSPPLPSSTLHSLIQPVVAQEKDLLWLIKSMRQAWIDALPASSQNARRKVLHDQAQATSPLLS